MVKRVTSSENQYKMDFFRKLRFDFQKGKTILDVGCGDGGDGRIFNQSYELTVYGTDIYKHKNIMSSPMRFKLGGIFHIPFHGRQFDYVFTHDVLHHIDEPLQRKSKHLLGLRKLRLACKIHGYLIVVEANRFNPLFYPHMVRMLGHAHFSQTYFKKIIRESFPKDRIKFNFFEAHLYPPHWLEVFRIYEYIMEHLMPKVFIAYNAAIIQKI